MNELKVEFGNAGYIYYETEKKTAFSAYDEFIECLRSNGINDDNLRPSYAVLRDRDGYDIGEVETEDL